MVSLVSAALVAAAGCAPRPSPPVFPSPPPEGATETTAPLPAEGRHYTIQIHAGSDAALADETASVARDRFDVPVVVQEEAGEYHVEVGEFASPDDAHAFLEIVRERGYPAASVHPLPLYP